jgi:hypothetical protein
VTEGKDIFQGLLHKTAERREEYKREILQTGPFQDGLRGLVGLTDDFVLALGCTRLMASRLPSGDDYLLTRLFGGQLMESANAIELVASNGMQNPAQRELSTKR